MHTNVLRQQLPQPVQRNFKYFSQLFFIFADNCSNRGVEEKAAGIVIIPLKGGEIFSIGLFDG
jgi:hypothetical protein